MASSGGDDAPPQSNPPVSNSRLHSSISSSHSSQQPSANSRYGNSSHSSGHTRTQNPKSRRGSDSKGNRRNSSGGPVLETGVEYDAGLVAYGKRPERWRTQTRPAWVPIRKPNNSCVSNSGSYGIIGRDVSLRNSVGSKDCRFENRTSDQKQKNGIVPGVDLSSVEKIKLTSCEVDNAAALTVASGKNELMFSDGRCDMVGRSRKPEIQVMVEYAENSDVQRMPDVLLCPPAVIHDKGSVLEHLGHGIKKDFGEEGVPLYDGDFRLPTESSDGAFMTGRQLGVAEPPVSNEFKSVLPLVVPGSRSLRQDNGMIDELNNQVAESLTRKASNTKYSVDGIRKQQVCQNTVKNLWKPGTSKVADSSAAVQGSCTGHSNRKLLVASEPRVPNTGRTSMPHAADVGRNQVCIGESRKVDVSGHDQEMEILTKELCDGGLLTIRHLDHVKPVTGSKLKSFAPPTERTDPSCMDNKIVGELNKRVAESVSPIGEESEMGQRTKQQKSLNKTKKPQKHQKEINPPYIAVSLEVKEQKLLRKMMRKAEREALVKRFRPDPRGDQVISEPIRKLRRQLRCPAGIHITNDHFVAIYRSLVPTEEEKAKKKQLLTSLEKLVSKEWPRAKLHVYGSCENSFGIIHSDVDICLSIDEETIDKSDFLLKLAAILEDGDLQSVQAVVCTRVPIVKFIDPHTGISCDISVNNHLPLVNTKLLRDYAKVDGRVRQLALMVKHWAKCRKVNDPFHRTLSSYTYVLMCINFLQQRKPVVLPCLQAMRATYTTTVDGLECAFFDQVDEIHHFGNNECLSQLLWGFFYYWAYRHNYKNDVISVRSGSILSKQSKDWTLGGDRRECHFISIEDPLDTAVDLGRVVDRRGLRILREEFERAAQIMQDDPQPWTTLFEAYVAPPSPAPAISEDPLLFPHDTILVSQICIEKTDSVPEIAL